MKEVSLTTPCMNALKATTVLTKGKPENHSIVPLERIVIQQKLLMKTMIVGLAMKVTSVTRHQFTQSLVIQVMHAH
jgi:hypothetical protein